MIRLNRNNLLLLSFVTALALAAALPVLTYPMGRDQGMYANIARTILNGGLPFIDMWDIKPPAIYYIYAVGIAIFGPGSAALRAIDFVTVPLTMTALYGLTLRLTGRRGAAALAAGLFPIFYFTETFASLTQSDSVVTLPMTLAVLCVVRAGDAPRGRRDAVIWSLLAGMLCAATLWFKHYYALFVLALVIEHLLARRAIPFKEALAFSLGGLIVGGIPLLIFMTNGVLNEMLAVFRGTSQYNAQAATGLGDFLTQMRGYLQFRWWHWGALLVLAASWPLTAALRLLPRPERDWGRWRVVGLWLASGLGFVLIQAKGFDTHWIPMLPPLTIFGAVALDRWVAALVSRFPTRYSRLVMGGVYGAIVIFFGAILIKDTWIRAWPYLTGAEGQVSYYSRFQANDMKPDESLQVIRYLERHTTPGDTLFVWGFRPEIYYLSKLRPATRFQAQFPLASDYYPVAWKQENVDVLWAALPPYVLVLQADWMPWVTGRDADSAWMLAHDYPALNDWLICNYERVREMGDFIIWRRLDQNCLVSG